MQQGSFYFDYYSHDKKTLVRFQAILGEKHLLPIWYRKEKSVSEIAPIGVGVLHIRTFTVSYMYEYIYPIYIGVGNYENLRYVTKGQKE